MFLKALECEPEVVPKAMINLGLLYNTRGDFMAQTGDLAGAKKAAIDAARYLDEGKARLDDLASNGKLDAQLETFAPQYRKFRLQTHRLVGQLHAGGGDMSSCEAEFRRATDNFPEDSLAWQMLSRILEIQGKEDEAARAVDRAKSLMK